MIKVIIPKTGADMEEAIIVSWKKSEGDKVAKGEVLFEIETDKAIMEVESPDAGILIKRLYSEGDKAPATSTAAVIGSGSESAADVDSFVGGGEAAPEKIQSQATQTATPQAAASTVASRQEESAGGTAKASPVARRLAKEKGIDLATIKGSGPAGRIEREDVLLAATNARFAETTPSPVAPADVVVPLTAMRRAIARRMVQSKTEAPDFNVTIAIDMTNALAQREQYKARGIKVSINDQLIHAVSRTLLAHPTLNATFEGEAIRLFGEIHIGSAVGTDEGLFVPVIRSAQKKSLEQIAEESKALAEKARSGKLLPNDMTGGTFTISNLGMFGIDSFTAIVNPPQSAILAVGGLTEQPARGKDNQIAWKSMMKVTLSVDHRVADGMTGAKFLSDLKALLERA